MGTRGLAATFSLEWWHATRAVVVRPWGRLAHIGIATSRAVALLVTTLSAAGCSTGRPWGRLGSVVSGGFRFLASRPCRLCSSPQACLASLYSFGPFWLLPLVRVPCIKSLRP